MATFQDTTVNDLGFIQIPAGSTAQRPAENPRLGAIRFNTDTNRIELWNGSNWISLGI